MDNYTIYCTEEQVHQALKLGAPINTRWGYNGYHPMPFIKEISIEYRHYAEVPTAEQMIGWLEKQGLHISIIYDDCTYKPEVRDAHDGFMNNDEYFNSRKEASLAAINTALEYLNNK